MSESSIIELLQSDYVRERVNRWKYDCLIKWAQLQSVNFLGEFTERIFRMEELPLKSTLIYINNSSNTKQLVRIVVLLCCVICFTCPECPPSVLERNELCNDDLLLQVSEQNTTSLWWQIALTALSKHQSNLQFSSARFENIWKTFRMIEIFLLHVWLYCSHWTCS